MRWVAAGFFVVLALISAFVALELFVVGTDEGETQSDVIAIGIGVVLVAIGAVYGATWVFRRFRLR